jgi:hypothetical protein
MLIERFEKHKKEEEEAARWAEEAGEPNKKLRERLAEMAKDEEPLLAKNRKSSIWTLRLFTASGTNRFSGHCSRWLETTSSGAEQPDASTRLFHSFPRHQPQAPFCNYTRTATESSTNRPRNSLPRPETYSPLPNTLLPHSGGHRSRNPHTISARKYQTSSRHPRRYITVQRLPLDDGQLL